MKFLIKPSSLCYDGMIPTKVCTGCNHAKDIGEFRCRDHTFNSKCHECEKEYAQSDKTKQRLKEYQQTDNYKEYVKKYRQTDKYKERKKKYQQTAKYKEYKKKYMKKRSQSDEYKEYMKKYMNSEKRKEYNKKRKQTAKYKEYMKKYMKKRRESDEYKEYIKKYQQSDKFKEYQKEYQKSDKFKKYQKEYQKIPHNKIALNLRKRVRDTIKKGHKSAHTINLLGCTVDFLMHWLELQFKDGMSWENYGNPNGDHSDCWHIDHIRPCASFDLTDPKQQKECFHYTNLQPLWGIENISKGAKI